MLTPLRSNVPVLWTVSRLVDGESAGVCQLQSAGTDRRAPRVRAAEPDSLKTPPPAILIASVLAAAVKHASAKRGIAGAEN